MLSHVPERFPLEPGSGGCPCPPTTSVIKDANSTIVYANFFGLGADNRTPLGNQADGVRIEGTSDRTAFGGNIPLGNVTSANGRNGLEIKDSASRTFVANAFGGVAAFNPTAAVGNHGDGILVTSTGGGKFFGKSRFSTIILTCQESGNDGHGIEIAGRASGVQVSQSVVGMQTNGLTPQPNGRDGIAIHGGVSWVSIGGFEPSVAGVPQNGSFLEAANLISGNLANGVSIAGNTRRIKIINSYLGVAINGLSPAGNGGAGISIGGSSRTHIGSAIGMNQPRNRNLIGFNAGAGVAVLKGKQNGILGNSIYGNGNPGIVLTSGANRNQPAPVLTSATVHIATGVTQVVGTLTAAPSSVYEVEIFASIAPGGGNGQFLLGSHLIRTNPRGIARFEILGLINPNPATANFLTATATSLSGNTSMFSEAIKATS